MKRIRAKRTKYCGVQFRSRTEAKYCALFNMFDEAWTYESKWFKLPTANYLPDFFMLQLKMWLEIKGIAPTKLEVVKCQELAHETGQDVAIAYGWPPAGLRLFSPIKRYWLEKFWAYHSESKKLRLCSKMDHEGCVVIPDAVIRSIDDYFKK